MSLKGVMAHILRYFTPFVVVKLLGLPRFQNLLLIVYVTAPVGCGVCKQTQHRVSLSKINLLKQIKTIASTGL